jgi:hypothetical protein
MKQTDRISHVKKREIQAPVVTAIINEFIAELGKEETLRILAGAIGKDAIKSGKELAEHYDGNSMKELAKLIREVWCEDGAMEIEILEESGSEFHFNVTKCKYAEVYRGIDEMELGKCLSCNRDFPFNRGFNPEISLERSKTIMEGDEICDFRYSLHL